MDIHTFLDRNGKLLIRISAKNFSTSRVQVTVGPPMRTKNLTEIPCVDLASRENENFGDYLLV